MKVIIDEKKIEEVLSRGVEDIFVKEELKKKFLSGKILVLNLALILLVQHYIWDMLFHLEN